MRLRQPLGCNPQTDFLRQMFAQRKRVDGRQWDEARERKVRYDQRHRVAHASVGRTRMLCGIDCDVSAPRKSNKPNAGTISFTMEVLPMAHPSPGELRKEVDECLQLLDTLYRETYCIDFDTLCVEANHYVLELKCLVCVLDYDGALWDCATLVTTALVGLRRNDVSFNRNTQQLLFYSEFERAQIPLTMYYRPTTITFGFVASSDPGCVEGGDGFEKKGEGSLERDPIVDPTPEESVLIDGYLVIGANHRDEICLMHQIGNLDIDKPTLLRCTDLVIERAKTVVAQITEMFKKLEDEKAKTKGRRSGVVPLGDPKSLPLDV